MKRLAFVLLAGIALSGVTGCFCDGSGAHAPRASLYGDGPMAQALRCHACRGQGCPRCIRGGGHGTQLADPGAAQVSYPYYTVRGPRDYLNPLPPSIGP